MQTNRKEAGRDRKTEGDSGVKTERLRGGRETRTRTARHGQRGGMKTERETEHELET